MSDKIFIAINGEAFSRKDSSDALRCQRAVKEALVCKGFFVDSLFLEPEDFIGKERLKERLARLDPFCVFNLFEGFEDDSSKEAEFAEVLEDCEVDFTGSSSLALRLCLNKGEAKNICRSRSIAVPPGWIVRKMADAKQIKLQYPLFIKPLSEDASLGIDCDSLLAEESGLRGVLEEKLDVFPAGLIVEEFISGKEYSVALMGDYPYEIMGISVMDYSKHKNLEPFFAYKAKWEDSSDQFKILTPSLTEDMEKGLRDKIIDTSVRAGRALGCRNYFRVDLRQRGGEIFVIDINPNPDINRDSGFMKQAYFKGYTYEDVIEKIFVSAVNSGKKAVLSR
ncbi:MAG: ATP-grasp domain-containing protein [Candidatus Omnitrophota bacterium]